MVKVKCFVTYLTYLIRHRWFVMIECWKMKLYWQGLVHDWHKFLPSEFIPYMHRFGGGIQRGRDDKGYYNPNDTGDPAFDLAWFLHQKRCYHHWQSWCIPLDGGAGVRAHEMPEKYAREMICDWRGAGRAQGTPDTLAWYGAHKDKLVLHPKTRELVESLLNV